MDERKLTLKDLKRWIKKYHKKYKGEYYNLLGFVENKELSPDVLSLFIVSGFGGVCGYDWIHGNNKMKDFIKETIKEIEK
jgi:hypothetical protein